MARRGIFVAPFEELADARKLARLAARAEAAGWDGFFLWDHVDYRPPVTALADPWVCMAGDRVRDRAGGHRAADNAAGPPEDPEACTRDGHARPPQRGPADLWRRPRQRQLRRILEVRRAVGRQSAGKAA